MIKSATKLSGFVFGEGRSDKYFLIALISLENFKYQTKNWNFNYGNGKGCSAHDVVDACYSETRGVDYDLILCFIDLDDLKKKFPKKWEKEKVAIEQKYSNIKVIWQLDNAEEEYKKVLGDTIKGKNKLNKFARENVKQFINSSFWKRILNEVKQKEFELSSQ